MKIIKESGEEDLFDKNKFCNSLRKAGAEKDIATTVCSQIEKGLSPGATTSDIFRKASHALLRVNRYAGIRYNLKRGVRNLGPAGFVFEQFVEIILKTEGYKTERNLTMQGECVEHEIDVRAMKDLEHCLIEAKLHSDGGAKVHIDVAMYAHARLDDIAKYQDRHEKKYAKHMMWLFTNTRYTHKAIQYVKCKKMKATGWSYPNKNESLEGLITRYHLYPVTILPSISKAVLEKLSKFGMILAQDIAPYTVSELGTKFGIKEREAKRILKDSQLLLYGEDGSN